MAESVEKEKIEIKPNAKQQECIDNIKGKFLVLAGPGTGKTFTIINRIKNMIKKEVEPSKILCLTFTDAAANEMRKRIEKELNILTSDINICTYHSFCSNIIDENLEEFEIRPNYKVISDSVSRAFIKECIDEIKPKYLKTDKNDPYFYIRKIRTCISGIKQYRLTKEKYFNNLKTNPDWEPEIEKIKKKIEEKIKNNKTNFKQDKSSLEKLSKNVKQAEEIWQFYELYQEKMYQNNYLDFNDMINFVLDKFDNEPIFLDKIANKYEYILVDEYQDTNNSQNEIIFSLAKALNSENIFVVGDDDQIIYRFQGAKLDTLEKFLRTFPDTKVICLDENMRSTQNILDASRAVVLQDNLRLENNPEFSKYNITKKLIATREELFSKNIPVRCYKYADIEQEYNEIVAEIENLVNSDECPKDKDGNKNLSQIAILTVSNGETYEFSQLLKLKNIPYELKEGKNIFDIPSVNMLYFYIQILVDEEMYSNKFFSLLMAPPFNIAPKDYQILYKNVSKKRTFIDAIKITPKEELLEPEKIKNFIKTYEYLKKYKTKENIKNTILEIGSKTGIFDYYLNTDLNKTENIAGLTKFIDEAKSFAEIYKTSFLEEFLDYIKAILNDEEQIVTEKAPVPLNAIQLCTYHSSKGREFEYVYMPTLLAEKWESSSKSLKSDIPLDVSEYKTADELKEMKSSDAVKLMYVGMTRAKHTLRLSYPEMKNGKNKKPSKYIATIQDIFEREKEPFTYTEQSYWEEKAKSLVKKDYDFEKDFAEFVDAKLNDRAFSASSINRYLACPRQYFYNDILNLEAKDGNPNYLSYGTAIHKACENAIKYTKENKSHPQKEDFIQWFKDELSTLPMENFQQRLLFEERGEMALDKYYAQIVNTPINSLFDAEYKLFDELNDIKFVGYIDRLDKNEDGTFTIYDYKTGNKKLGIAPDGEHEDYYNQMCLYKYFFEKQTGKKVSVTKFIYPEDFENSTELNLTEEECLNVVEKMKNAVENIRNYKFQPSFKQFSCLYCGYKDICGMKEKI